MAFGRKNRKQVDDLGDEREESSSLATADAGIDQDDFLAEGDPVYEEESGSSRKNGILMALAGLLIVGAAAGAYVKGYIPGVGGAKTEQIAMDDSSAAAAKGEARTNAQNNALAAPPVIEDSDTASVPEDTITPPEAQAAGITVQPGGAPGQPGMVTGGTVPADGRVSVAPGATVSAPSLNPNQGPNQPLIKEQGPPPESMTPAQKAQARKDSIAAAKKVKADEKRVADEQAKADRLASLEQQKAQRDAATRAAMNGQPVQAEATQAEAGGVTSTPVVRKVSTRRRTRPEDLPYDDPRAPWNK